MTSIWVTLIFMHTVYGKQIHDLILIRLNSVTLTNICDHSNMWLNIRKHAVIQQNIHD